MTEEQERGERDAELAEEAKGSSDPHTGEGEGHPAGDGERSDRAVGGPTSRDEDPDDDGDGDGDDGDVTGGAHGTRPADEGFDAHT